MGQDYPPPKFLPNLLILISGKRKCGKDYLVERLQKRLDEQKIETGIMRISAPIKHFWSEKHKLDFNEMLSASEYKEQHRVGMVEWSMGVRAENYGYFCVEAIRMAEAVGKSLWICVDIRHQRDYDWFMEFYSDRLKRVRVTANDEVRKPRGWTFTEGVDDAPTECSLDHVSDWDLVVQNNEAGGSEVETALDTIMGWINAAGVAK